jgi:hypothetical protein
MQGMVYIVIHGSDDLLYNGFTAMIHVKHFLSELEDSIRDWPN